MSSGGSGKGWIFCTPRAPLVGSEIVNDGITMSKYSRRMIDSLVDIERLSDVDIVGEDNVCWHYGCGDMITVVGHCFLGGWSF